MHKLVSMSDDDRDRLIDEFWTEVTDGLEVRPTVVDRLRARLTLPEEPTTEQLEAWIELADLVRDEAFRREVREFLHELYSTDRARHLASPDMVATSHRREAILQEARAAYLSGVATDSPRAQDIAHRFVASLAETYGRSDVAGPRRRMATPDPASPAARRGREHGARIGRLFGRYTSLVATINGKPQEVQEQEKATNVAVIEWLNTAVATPER
jgi:hypothetical protein